MATQVLYTNTEQANNIPATSRRHLPHPSIPNTQVEPATHR